ncbi:sugar O-acetyltransferase [Ligilactobacillus aviarius]|uniref:sugar O-acetyltransferase n=1 Tax=Ligilactobacillus aviarius TaxID=1606 RepID=UPI00388EC2FC
MKQTIEEVNQLINNQEFDARNPRIMTAHQRAFNQCFEYNRQVNQNHGYNLELLTALFNQIGTDPYIEPDFHCQFGFNITMGNEVFLNHDCTLMDYAPITIGNQANIAPKVGMYTAQPALDPQKREHHIMTARPITIKNNVWIGGNVCILGGVTIGNNAIIGAGSVVDHDVPDNAVVVGNPAKVIRIIQ